MSLKMRKFVCVAIGYVGGFIEVRLLLERMYCF